MNRILYLSLLLLSGPAVYRWISKPKPKQQTTKEFLEANPASVAAIAVNDPLQFESLKAVEEARTQRLAADFWLLPEDERSDYTGGF